jgi:hypothetical protein
MEVPSTAYIELIDQMKQKLQIRIRKNYATLAIFVFKYGKFLDRYDGITSAGKALNITPLTIKKYIESKTSYLGYTFSHDKYST